MKLDRKFWDVDIHISKQYAHVASTFVINYIHSLFGMQTLKEKIFHNVFEKFPVFISYRKRIWNIIWNLIVTFHLPESFNSFINRILLTECNLFKIIEVARLDGSNRKAIIKDHLHDPKSIAVYPQKGFLFWTDWVVPKIERSLLDGSERKSLVSSQLNFPIGLVVDYDLRRLYWIDAKLNEERVETTDLHGHNRVILSIQSTHPFSLTQVSWKNLIKLLMPMLMLLSPL